MAENIYEKYGNKIIDGKRIATEYRAEIATEVAAMERKPSLAVIIVGEDPASQVYVRNKERGCAEVGMTSLLYRLPTETTEEELLRLIEHLNADSDVDGILVQLPLPSVRDGGSGIDEGAVIAAVSPEKDVDAFRAENVGHIMLRRRTAAPLYPGRGHGAARALGSRDRGQALPCYRTQQYSRQTDGDAAPAQERNDNGSALALARSSPRSAARRIS